MDHFHLRDLSTEEKAELFDIVDTLAHAAVFTITVNAKTAFGEELKKYPPAVVYAMILGNLRAGIDATALDTGFCTDCTEEGFDFGRFVKNESLEMKNARKPAKPDKNKS